MSKTVLIVEKDLALMRQIRATLEHRGFGVEETTDGKGAPELIRRRRPDCVVLAVDLDAGQNGYIICKKLKSEADLRTVPVIIIGDPKGFEKHQQLKTRAEDYLGKPFEAPSLADHVGGLVGFPQAELPPPGVSDGFEPALGAAEELALDSGTGEVPMGSDADFELVDSALEERVPATAEQPEVAYAPAAYALAPEEEIPVSTESGELVGQERTVVAPMPLPPEPALSRPSRPPGVPFQSSPSVSIDPAEGRELRAKVTELTGALHESRSHASELENRLRELEQELEHHKAELDLSRSAPGRSESKEVFALRDAANKKDKEILRLKGELNTKEQEIVELRDRENALEQQASEAGNEVARRDAQLKTAQARTEQLTQERKRLDQQLLAAREEARSASARLSTLQSDYDALQARLGELEATLEPAQRGHQEAENARVQAEALLAEARSELDSTRGHLESLRGGHEQAQLELESARGQLAAQAGAFADEISGLRQRLAESEAGLRRHEEQAQKREARLKAHQERLDRLRAELGATLQSLDEAPRDSDDVVDELAEA